MLSLLAFCVLAPSSRSPVMTVTVRPGAQQGRVWSCEKPVVEGLNVWGAMGEGKFLAPFSGSASSATFTPNEPGDKMGTANFQGPPLELHEGDEVEISMSVTNMTCSFSGINVIAERQGTISRGVRDPWTPPADSQKFKFTFKPKNGVRVAGMSFRCAPTQSVHYGSCGVSVAWAFKPGPRVTKDTDLKLGAVDCHTWSHDDLSQGKPSSFFPVQRALNRGDYDFLYRDGKDLAGVAADGVSLVLLRTNIGQAGSATFSAKGGGSFYRLDDPRPFASAGAASLTAEAYAFDTNQYYAYALYRPPSSYGPGGPGKSVEFQVSTNGKTATKTLELVRPPVILVHGTYDNPLYCYWKSEPGDDAPTNLGPLLKAKGFTDVATLDWEETNGMKDPSDFETNSTTVRSNKGGINDAVAEMRRRNIAVTQCDLICHSQGGVIARVYAKGFPLMVPLDEDHPHYNDVTQCAAKGCWYHRQGNYSLGDIHRLITISSTHRGSAVCRMFVALDAYSNADDASALKQLFTRLFVFGVDKTISGVTTGGFYNQVPFSDELKAIGPTPVPSHAIACTATDEDMKKQKVVTSYWPTDVTGYGDYYGKLYKIFAFTADDAKTFAFDWLATQAKSQIPNDDRPKENADTYRELLGRQSSLRGKLPPELQDEIINHMRKTVFLDDENDCTVALQSSWGGLEEPYRFKAEHCLHGWAPRYRVVQEQLLRLLDNDGSLFDSNGFPSAYGPGRCRTAEFIVPTLGSGGILNDQPQPPGNRGATGDNKADRGGAWSGQWDTHNSWGIKPITLTQNGNVVTGVFSDGHGRFKGTVTGNVLKLTYDFVDYNDGGTAEFTMAPDGKSWKGTYVSRNLPDLPIWIQADKVGSTSLRTAR